MMLSPTIETLTNIFNLYSTRPHAYLDKKALDKWQVTLQYIKKNSVFDKFIIENFLDFEIKQIIFEYSQLQKDFKRICHGDITSVLYLYPKILHKMSREGIFILLQDRNIHSTRMAKSLTDLESSCLFETPFANLMTSIREYNLDQYIKNIGVFPDYTKKEMLLDKYTLEVTLSLFSIYENIYNTPITIQVISRGLDEYILTIKLIKDIEGVDISLLLDNSRKLILVKDTSIKVKAKKKCRIRCFGFVWEMF